ncbi:MAG: universal stress protein [Methanobacteriaceae archaeon]|nr:universal stress protein [Methanobacteriaceae archaeon]
MFKNILLPVDGSELSDKATKVAIDLAKKLDSTIIVLHVMDNKLIQPYEILEEEGRVIINKTIKQIKKANVNYVKYMIYANPHDDIRTIVRKSEADLIIMGTHGRTGIRKVLMGSIAQDTLKKTDIPVMLIK